MATVNAPTSNLPTYDTLTLEKRGLAALITINRPQVMNALNGSAIRELGTAIAAVRDDPDVRGLVITGAGDKAFVAGADISELAKASATEAAAHARAGQQVFGDLETLGKPVVAAINGVALGGGCELALACTVRLASVHAKFGQPEIKLGLVPGFGGTQRLPRLIGKAAALEMILTGDMIGAEDALRLGLVTAILEPADLITRAINLVERIGANAPLAVAYALEAVHLGLDGPIGPGLALESRSFGLCAATEDMREGTAAFLEKRPPRFAGR